MPTAGGLSWALAVVMIAVAGYHGARLVAAAVRRRRHEADVDVAHAAMGVVMALMLVGSLTPAATRTWAFAAAVPTVWFLGRGAYSYVMDGARAIGHSARQAITCAAMLYMLIVATGAHIAPPVGSMTGMAMPAGSSGNTAPSRLLGIVLIAAMAGVIAWTAHAARRWPRRMEPAGAFCQLAMSATSVYMLAVLV